MLLSEFIKEQGDECAAILFRVKPRTAASWRRGEGWPRRSKAIEIVQLTGGTVSLEEIYAPPAAPGNVQKEAA